MGQFVFDHLTGEVTILAVNRANRKDETGVTSSTTKDEGGGDKKDNGKIRTLSSEGAKVKSSKTDFFAKGNEHLTPPTLYKDMDDWNVRVFKNKFPLLEDHEVIVHSPHQDKDIEDLSCEHTVKIIRAYLNRVHYYGGCDKEVIIFNNRGGKAGASILHPHSQIVAAKGFPGVIEDEKESALHYYNEYNSCFWCDKLKEGLKDGSRIVHESSHFVVHTLKASRWSYETRVVPKEHKPNFGFMGEQEIQDLAVVMKGLLSSYDRLFGRPDRNFWIHTMRYEPYHWHIGVMVHLKVLGALELGAGIWVSDKATPEDAARELRNNMSTDCEETTDLLD